MKRNRASATLSYSNLNTIIDVAEIVTFLQLWLRREYEDCVLVAGTPEVVNGKKLQKFT